MSTDALKRINAMSHNTMLAQLGIVITEIGDNMICGTMPVDHRTHQPMGLLHGGASAALIESLGSIGSSMRIDHTTQAVVGLEINANHVRGIKSGMVTGKAELIHGGKTTHIWNVTITDESGKLICTGRLTVLVIDKK